ncbi:glycosyltransferase family 2 protein [Kineococcus sp. SYSU DK006]|uniref:glycosyltransferase family 2 protein n=1 Tax=Kineococcus sp. SYSU DK006 TaxID=3383127 RepID=UPI003D7DC77D
MTPGDATPDGPTAVAGGERAPARRTADVAVVVPAKDAVGVLDGALASFAAQTVRPAEVVVVDDGSSDGTAALARSWADQLPVRVVRLRTSVGPGRARRAGVDSSSARLLTFLDADDVVLPTHLEELVALHERHGGIVSPDGLFWWPGKGIDPLTYRHHRPVREPAAQWHDVLTHNFLTTASLVSRADHDAAGGWRGDYDGAEDWDLWIRLLRDGVRVTAGSATYLYRQSVSSLSRESRTAEASLRLVQSLLPQLGPADRAVAARSRRRWRAQVATGRALRHARAGRSLAARTSALPALASPSRGGTARGLALVLAPRSAAELADRRAERLWSRG